MRDIKRKKYEKVVKLLKSDNQDDVKLGVERLRHIKFTREELIWNFPSRDIKSRNFSRSGDSSVRTQFTTVIDGIRIYINSHWVYALDYEDDPYDYTPI